MDITRIVPDSPADPGMRSLDVTGRQRPADPSLRRTRRQRDAARRGRALVDGQGAINETVLACRAAARLAAQDRATRAWRGPGGKHPRPIRQRWGAFLLQTGRGHLTVAQARSVRLRSTRDELLALDAFERQLLGSAL